MARRPSSWLLAALLLVLLAEGGARLLGPGPRISSRGVNAALWIHDPRLGWVNRRGARVVHDGVRGRPLVRTDARGHRRSSRPGPGTRRAPGHPEDSGRGLSLLFLGDSTTFGAEVGDTQTLPARVGAELRDRGTLRGPLRVTNAAVRGYSTLQVERSLERSLESFLGTGEPVDLVVYVLTGNDLVESFFPSLPVQAPAPRWVPDGMGGFRVEEVRGRGLLPSPGEPPPEATGWRAFTGDLRRVSALADLGADLTRQGLLLAAALGNRIHGDPGGPGERESPSGQVGPGSQDGSEPAGGAGDCPEGLAPGPGPGAALRAAWRCGAEEALGEALERMARACSKRGAGFLVTPFPGAPRPQRDRLFPRSGSLEALCRARGVDYLEAPEGLPGPGNRDRAPRPWLGHDPHFGVEGTARWARGLAPGIGSRLVQREKPPSVLLLPGSRVSPSRGGSSG